MFHISKDIEYVVQAQTFYPTQFLKEIALHTFPNVHKSAKIGNLLSSIFCPNQSKRCFFRYKMRFPCEQPSMNDKCLNDN